MQPFRTLPKATGFLQNNGKNGCIANSKQLRDAHVDEGNAAHASASLAVAFGQHAAAMDSNVVSNHIERENALAYPCAPLPKATRFLNDDGKNGRIAIREEASDAHVDEGHAPHGSASLAVAFARHAAAMDSSVLSNRIEMGNTPRNPSARFRRPRGA